MDNLILLFKDAFLTGLVYPFQSHFILKLLLQDIENNNLFLIWISYSSATLLAFFIQFYVCYKIMSAKGLQPYLDKNYHKYSNIISRYFFVIFFVSLIPPFGAIITIIAGFMRINPKIFFSSIFVGTIIYIALATLGIKEIL